MPFQFKYDSIENYLKSYGKYILRQARKILSKRKATGKLSKSLRAKVEDDKGSLTLRFYASKYADYINKGVAGTRGSRTYLDVRGKRLRSPYKFTSSSDLRGLEGATGLFAKWAERKGIKSSNISNKSLGFAIAEGVKRKGIPAASFYTQPISYSYKIFRKELEKNFKKDILKGIKILNKKI